MWLGIVAKSVKGITGCKKRLQLLATKWISLGCIQVKFRSNRIMAHQRFFKACKKVTGQGIKGFYLVVSYDKAILHGKSC